MIKELQSIKNFAFDAWFNENYKKEDLEQQIIKAAKKGYSGMRFDITEVIQENERLMRKNPLFELRFKEMFPELDVSIRSYTKKELTGHVFNLKWTDVTHRELLISWEKIGEEK